MRRSKDARLVSTAVADARRKLRQIESSISKERGGKERSGANVSASGPHADDPSKSEEGWTPRVGDSVFVPSIQSHAVVEKIGGGKLTLRKGMMTMTKIRIDQVQPPQ